MIATREKTTTMLYCPKCRRTYENGTQRFCDNDGGRLLPAPSAQKSDSQTDSIFSHLLGKNAQKKDDTGEKPKSAPRFVPLNKTEESDRKLTSFPSAGRIFQSEQFLKPKPEKTPEPEDSILELEPVAEKDEDDLLEFEPVLPTEASARQVETPLIEEETPLELEKESPKPAPPPLVKTDEIAFGSRQTSLLGRASFNPKNTSALVGQTVKGRYLITEELAPDNEESEIYLAEDRSSEGGKAVVRVFLDSSFAASDTAEKILAEERVSLSHLNHPNIAGVFDSGKLQEGGEFIVSEFVEGKTLAETLQPDEQFNALRTGRIIRQAAYALNQAHNCGVLHRNLTPESLVLTVSDAGIEQVKLVNFGVSRGEITDKNLAYKAPEEVEKGNSSYAGDIYSLAVIAYQMLTGQLPFNVDSRDELLINQKVGLPLLPTDLRPELRPLADQVLEKALAFKPSDRYAKACDFGDAFFNVLSVAAPSWSKAGAEFKSFDNKLEEPQEFAVAPLDKQKDVLPKVSTEKVVLISPLTENSEVKATEDLAWEKRSPEPPKTGSFWIGGTAILGVIVLLLGLWGISRLIANRANQSENQTGQTQNAPVAPTEPPTANVLPTAEADLAPEPRLQKTPPDTERFQNSRQNLKGELAKNFLGFEIFYPQNWTKKDSETNFLDVSKRDANDFPIEQMIITRYESRGTMTLDRPNFPKLVAKSNQDLKKSLGDSFKVVSSGENTIQNGRWKVYEVKFQSTGKNEKGENITLWGRRLWLPLQSAGTQNGFVITMLATSLSDVVKSVEDVGVQGDLANVLETFEPEQF